MLPKQKTLVANRGEIAVRIFKTIREMGCVPVAIYAKSFPQEYHLQFADESFAIESASPSQAYLNAQAIVEIAKEQNCIAIHPGYGFLSENAGFAQLCEKNKITFIGPSASSIEIMGDKIKARKQAKSVDLPMIEGSGVIENTQDLQRKVTALGYPVLLKAKAGGGGKGMRRVDQASDLETSFHLAQSEAQKSFGNADMYVEKYVLQPRHVEIQVFGFQNGDVICLGTRDCSLQRRHQKIIEEAPAPFLTSKLVETMEKASIALAKSVSYQGAGTIEYLVDQDQNFYFLEMNTRLQVEHPVTESIFDVDLVAWQIQTALDSTFSKATPPAQGHSIELRICAEDPSQNFFPSPGTLSKIFWPSKKDPSIRIDSGVGEGSTVSLHFDPMVAKIIVKAKNRDACINAAIEALQQLSLIHISEPTRPY